MGIGDQNSGPHPCRVNVLIHRAISPAVIPTCEQKLNAVTLSILYAMGGYKELLKFFLKRIAEKCMQKRQSLCSSRFWTVLFSVCFSWNTLTPSLPSGCHCQLFLTRKSGSLHRVCRFAGVTRTRRSLNSGTICNSCLFVGAGVCLLNPDTCRHLQHTLPLSCTATHRIYLNIFP